MTLNGMPSFAYAGVKGNDDRIDLLEGNAIITNTETEKIRGVWKAMPSSQVLRLSKSEVLRAVKQHLQQQEDSQEHHHNR